jgi:hypothetical protein
VIDIADINAAVHRLRGVAECCDLTTTAVYFYSEHKDGLAEDIRLVLERLDELEANLADKSAAVKAHVTINLELHHRITEAVAESLAWQARHNELERQLSAQR